LIFQFNCLVNSFK